MIHFIEVEVKLKRSLTYLKKWQLTMMIYLIMLIDTVTLLITTRLHKVQMIINDAVHRNRLNFFENIYKKGENIN